MTTPTPDEICKRLRLQARRVSETMRIMAQAKSLRQAHNPPRDDLYMWPKPEETVEWQAADLIQQQLATIERLSAALEIIERGTVNDAFGKPIKITLFRMRSIARAALGKDASDDRSPGSSEGE